MKLKGTGAVVTGGGSGIGRAIAELFASEGARVVIADFNESAGSDVARVIRENGGDAIAITTNVADPESVRMTFSQLDERGIEAGVLVNNAGNASHLIPIHEMTDEEWDSIVRVHLNGTFYCTREAVRRMAVRGSGSIINMGSVAGLRGLPGGASYTAAKGGIIAFTKGVAQEVASIGIRVNCIAPGWIETPILENLPPEMRPLMTQMTALGRIGQPEEIARVALFLATDDSSFVVGQTISPNGGLYF